MSSSRFRGCCLSGAVLIGCSIACGADLLQTGEFRWQVSAPLVAPAQRADDPCCSVKDPTVVFHKGRWHIFATIRSEKRTHQIEYLNFMEWARADGAPRHVLKVCDGYFCAPQVFYFTPHRKWYLLFQTGDKTRTPKLQPTVCTTGTLDNPGSWSRPEVLWDCSWPNVPRAIDFWMICDDARAHLFFTSNDGKLWRSETALAAFPRGWGEPRVVLQGDIFEASHTYKIKGRNLYLTLIEAQAGEGRYYKAYTASRLDGEWTALAATRENPFAGAANATEAAGGAHWTDSISHGELLRAGCDERLEIEPERLLFLFQGVADDGKRGKPYGKIPWRLGLLELSP